MGSVAASVLSVSVAPVIGLFIYLPFTCVGVMEYPSRTCVVKLFNARVVQCCGGGGGGGEGYPRCRYLGFSHNITYGRNPNNGI